MSLSLWGAVTPSDVVDVVDDGEGLRVAAASLLAALGDTATITSRAHSAWSTLNTVFVADQVTPALAPLMTPANLAASRLHSAAEQFSSIANAAARELATLKSTHDSLVASINHFHSSAAGRADAHIRLEISRGNLAAAALYAFHSWTDIPTLVNDEWDLRSQVRTHNANVENTLNSIAGQITRIEFAPTPLPGVKAAASVTPKTTPNGWDRLWLTLKASGEAAWIIGTAPVREALPYVEDGLSTAGNATLSFMNAMVQHPDEFGEMLGGALMTAGGAAMTAAGGGLDLTGVGILAGGGELTVAGVGVIAGGAGMVGDSAGKLADHANSDSKVDPLRTDNVAKAEEKAAAAKQKLTDEEHVQDLNKKIDELKETDPNNWKVKVYEGQKFNYENYGRYPENEVRLENGKVLDSYKPDAEIVSRKFTQLSDIKPETAKSYINEIDAKYAPGTAIKGGGKLFGDEILEVPVQKAPIPEELLKYADGKNPPVIIRDVTGHEYN